MPSMSVARGSNMLPETDIAKAEYIEMRDYRNRWRQDYLRACHGDLDEFKTYVLRWMAGDAEVAPLREIVDFAKGEDFLTPEMVEAAENTIAWGVVLRDLLKRSAA